VAGYAIAMLLGCQSLALVQAPAASAALTGHAPAPHTCHDPAGDGSGDKFEGQCPSTHAASAPAVIQIPAATALPTIAIREGILDRVVGAARPVESQLVLIEPPPLTILHCCLRN
jgi:hypothetical protein